MLRGIVPRPTGAKIEAFEDFSRETSISARLICRDEKRFDPLMTLPSFEHRSLIACVPCQLYTYVGFCV